MPLALRRPAVWSNFFYAVPLGVAILHELMATATAIAALFFFSFAFHYTKERKFVIADILSALVIAAFCLALLFSNGLRHGYLLLAVFLVIAGLYIRYGLEHGKRGGTLHGLWHLTAATLMLACIFSATG